MARLCSDSDGPPQMRDWPPALAAVGVNNSVGFCCLHPDLQKPEGSEDGLKMVLLAIRAAMRASPADFVGATAVVDTMSGDAGEARARAMQLTAMRYLHTLAHQQKGHSVAKRLEAAGLGDTTALALAEAKAKKENAAKRAADMRDECAVLYNKSIDPQMWATASAYDEVRDGLERNEVSALPELDSAKLGKRGYQPPQHSRLEVDVATNEIVAAAEEKVALGRSGIVLLQVERMVLLLLCAGAFTVDPSKYKSIGEAGLVNRASAPKHVAFGLDACDALMRRFTWISAYVCRAPPHARPSTLPRSPVETGPTLAGDSGRVGGSLEELCAAHGNETRRGVAHRRERDALHPERRVAAGRAAPEGGRDARTDDVLLSDHQRRAQGRRRGPPPVHRGPKGVH